LNSIAARIRAVIRRRVVVHGRVQGVAFRYSVQRMAQQRGIAGWVANRADGTVEAVFEGEAEAVDRVVDFCREGPRGAEVEYVEVTEEETEGLSGFGVR
jgi:acylphosphatase